MDNLGGVDHQVENPMVGAGDGEDMVGMLVVATPHRRVEDIIALRQVVERRRLFILTTHLLIISMFVPVLH